jgi:tetratricopeptide (TPR) repeat protein
MFALTSLAQACLWDWDTLQMERRRFPGVLEMITGKFVRHSPAYYEWRVRDRTSRMRSAADDPSLADDLAVAFSKLGRHAEGIALLEQVLATHPDRYETLANLGTIHMLAGDLETGKEFIDRAIVVNPNAHFGREKYQSLLAEYFLTERQSPHPASESTLVVHPKGGYYGFAGFVLRKRRHDDQPVSLLSADVVNEELAAAQTGVLGMMHFANYESPLLLEALGDLLIAWPTYQQDALQLAARAYFRIAEVSDDDATKSQFHAAAKNIVYGNLDYINFRGKWDEKKDGPAHDELEKLSADLESELTDARTFFAAIEADEQRWIGEGINVDEAFAAKYYDSLDSTVEAAQQQLASERLDVRGNPNQEAVHRALLILGALLAGFIALVAGCVVAYRRYRAKAR